MIPWVCSRRGEGRVSTTEEWDIGELGIVSDGFTELCCSSRGVG